MQERTYYPGDTNFRMADVIVINKANTATSKNIDIIKNNALNINPTATVYLTNSEIQVDRPDLVEGKKVLLIEDGPTLTHGEMPYGAGKFAAEKYGASEIVDPRPYLSGSFLYLHKKYPHLGKLIPAMGYWPEQIKDLEESINAVPCDVVVIATPMDLRKLVKIDKKPVAVVKYEVEDREGGDGGRLSDAIDEFVKKRL